MRIDLTEAAKFYGLRRVPKLVYSPERVGKNIAGFFLEEYRIYYGDFPTDEKIVEYFRNRLAKLGIGRLDYEDLMRFVFAHELYHAKQYERDPAGARRKAIEIAKEMEYEDILYTLGILPAGPSKAHDSDPLEIEADKYAAKAYKLVKITR